MSKTFDKNEGLPVRINLYVIKYIYYEMKKDRAHIFNENVEKGKKLKAKPIYSTGFFPFSRPRLDRISCGEPFQLSKDEAEQMASYYGIQTKYFTKNGATFFEIQEINKAVSSNSTNKIMIPKYIDEVSWKCFFNERYKTSYTVVDASGNAITETDSAQKAKDVECSLKNLVLNWKELKANNPLYAICYFFHNGASIGEELDSIEHLEKCLQSIEVRKWDKIELETVVRILKSMKEHCEYMEILVKLYAYRKKYQ